MEGIIAIFYKSAAGWGLNPSPPSARHNITAGSGVSYLGTLSSSDGRVEINVKITLLFGETAIFIVSYQGKNVPFQLKLPRLATEMEGYPGELDTGAIERYLNTFVFGPIVRPGAELPALAHLSTGLLLHILSFVEAADLCSIGKASKGLGAISKDDTLWCGLLLRAGWLCVAEEDVVVYYSHFPCSGHRATEETRSGQGPSSAAGLGPDAWSQYIERHQRAVRDRRRAAERDRARAEQRRQIAELRREWSQPSRAEPRALHLPRIWLPPLPPGSSSSGAPMPILPGFEAEDGYLLQPPWAAQSATTEDDFGLAGELGGAGWRIHF